MNHADIQPETLRAYLDAQLDLDTTQEIAAHLEVCVSCQTETASLGRQAACVHSSLDELPLLPPLQAARVSDAWATIARQIRPVDEPAAHRWSPFQIFSFAGGGLVTAALVVVLTVAPVRAWAESLLSVFRVQHFTVLELDASAGANLQNNQLLNQTISHILSDDVIVTQAPQKPKPISDPATASTLAGFPVKLLSGQTPSSLMLQSGVAAQMKLDRDRLQSILDEAGRTDLQVPASVDGATLAFRIPTGVLATYGDCGTTLTGMRHAVPGPASKSGNPPDVSTPPSGAPLNGPTGASCISLIQLPSPTVSAPPELDPAQIARIALQFLGMSANEAASFTQTVDWTSTLVLPVTRGQSTYEQIPVNGNEGVLLRPKGTGTEGQFSLMWVDSGIVYGLNGVGDDTTALNLAGQLQ